MLGDLEKTTTDKKRQRRKMKKVKHVRIKEKERQQKLKDASGIEGNKKLSKTQVADKLKKITMGGKATILKVSLFLTVVVLSLRGFMIGLVVVILSLVCVRVINANGAIHLYGMHKV